MVDIFGWSVISFKDFVPGPSSNDQCVLPGACSILDELVKLLNQCCEAARAKHTITASLRNRTKLPPRCQVFSGQLPFGYMTYKKGHTPCQNINRSSNSVLSSSPSATLLAAVSRKGIMVASTHLQTPEYWLPEDIVRFSGARLSMGFSHATMSRSSSRSKGGHWRQPTPTTVSIHLFTGLCLMANVANFTPVKT